MSKLRLAVGGLSNDFQKVPAIKALRQLAGIGLKEAKDAVEAAMLGELVNLGCNLPADALISNREAHNTLMEQGLELIDGVAKVEFIIAAVKESAKLAADEEEEALAILLLDVIRQHKENCDLKELEQENLREIARGRNHAERIRKEEIAELREQQEQRWQAEEERKQQYAIAPEDKRI